MISGGESAPDEGLGVATDWLGVAFHGHAITHLDSLGHMFWNKQAYNGIPASAVSMLNGATLGSIETARNGIVSRGVLLDMPSALNVPWLEPGHGITPDELELAERSQGIEVNSGDILYIRTGRDVPRNSPDAIDSNDRFPGLDISCMPWLHERSISVLGSDYVNDVIPSGVADSVCPVHIIGLVAMGLWLVDNLYLETLSERCINRGSWEFLCVLSPLVFSTATGSPINPLAIL
jgi:kynurenine formamidase